MKLLALAAAALLLACRSTTSEVRAPTQDESANTALAEGIALAKAEEHEAAIEVLTRAIERDPSSAEAYRWRGHCLNYTGSFEQALEDYDRAIELDPIDAWSHYANGMAQHNLKRYDLAIAGYTRALGIDINFVKAWNWRGFTRKLIGDYGGAASDLEYSLRLAPDDPWAQFELVKTLQAVGLYERCERALSRAAELEPLNASVRAQLGFLSAVRGSTSKSIEQLESAAHNHAPEETYARIWLWMQRADRAAADRELRAWFDDARIDDVWELQLTAFLLGEATDELMIVRAADETRRRVENEAPPDFLECEALFYSALRHEFRGERTEAHALYERASKLHAPEAWEWHMAHVRARALPR